MTSTNIWAALTLEGRMDVIAKLHMVEIGEGGYGTIAVPKEGFSDDDTVHNAVIDWLKDHGVHVLNTRMTAARLARSLRDRRYRGEEIQYGPEPAE